MSATIETILRTFPSFAVVVIGQHGSRVDYREHLSESDAVEYVANLRERFPSRTFRVENRTNRHKSQPVWGDE